MKILIVYATTEGQTRKIARACADTLVGAGHSVELVEAPGDAGLDVARHDAAILAASVHMGRYQEEMARFAAAHAEDLAARPTLFLAVSLAAAGTDATEHADLDRIAQDFFAKAGWQPTRIAQVAGAFRFTQYDFFKSWAMRWIAAQKGESVDPHADREYTDWTALRALVLDWAAAAEAHPA
jgi:menaquinone-dependent protoporphyrinogen oxidase